MPTSRSGQLQTHSCELGVGVPRTQSRHTTGARKFLNKKHVAFSQFGELLHSGNNPANLCRPVRSRAVKVLPGIGFAVDCSNWWLARFADALDSYR